MQQELKPKQANEIVLTEMTVTNFFFRDAHIPRYMIGSILRYVNEKISPGHFLRAVFENDFINAAGKADENNCEILYVYAALLVNHFPDRAYGSKEAVKGWLASREEEED